MIISASYKTDIPTFYGEWFMNRLRAGYCKMVNPYGRQIYRVSLLPQHVQGIVFWTKNLGPFLSRLPEVRQQGFSYVIQYSINGYPRTLEFSVVDGKRSVEHMKVVAGEYGPKTAVWRYDPIVFSSVTPYSFHLDNFEKLARSMQGCTDEVTISFAQIYKKTRYNMDWAANEFQFTWEDPSDETKHTLVSELAKCAQTFGMALTVCSQERFVGGIVKEARCIDTTRLSDVAGVPVRAPQKGNRPECACSEARDIGEYDTCPHGCVYCYAVRNRTLAQRRYGQHDPAGEFLFPPLNPPDDEPGPDDPFQLVMFE
jgi:hypothetical protein